MSKIATVYSNAIKNHFKIFYANWEPGVSIALGDYGYLNDNIFVPMGNLVDDYNEFKNNILKTITDPSKDQKEFKSKSGIQVNLIPSGTVSVQGISIAKAVLDIQFDSEDAVYFNAIGCTTTRISNKAKLGEILETIMYEGRWKKEYCVVTDVVNADKALIAISNSSSSGISFDVDSPKIQGIDLADASIKLSLKTEKNIGYKIPADEGLNLLIGLCKFKSSFIFNTPKFKPQLGFLKSVSNMDFAPSVKKEIVEFIQLGEDEI